jgi:hypothetical protein
VGGLPIGSKFLGIKKVLTGVIIKILCADQLQENQWKRKIGKIKSKNEKIP